MPEFPFDALAGIELRDDAGHLGVDGYSLYLLARYYRPLLRRHFNGMMASLPRDVAAEPGWGVRLA